MPHDERMLKSAFKGSKHPTSMSNVQYNTRRGGPGANMSQTPYVNKTYDMKGGPPTGFSPTQMSPDLDRHADIERKYERAQRRWEMVLDKKH